MIAIHCDKLTHAICFVKQAVPAGGVPQSLFGFPQFMSALALLVVVYTVTDVRHRFRLAVAPIPLYSLTYVLLAAIGVATLLTDIWLRERWLVPETTFLTASIWEGTWAALFLVLALTWIWYAFVHPPKFGRRNSFRYARELYRYILKGSDAELPVIADELARSAEQLIHRALAFRPEPAAPVTPLRGPGWLRLRLAKGREAHGRKPTPGECARDILLMLGNRKLCRHMVGCAPGAIIEILKCAGRAETPALPLSQFARNVAEEAISNRDSGLYHEDDGYQSGYFGYVKPLSESLFGNYDLISGLGAGFGSPLDPSYRSVKAWDSEQLSVFTRGALLALRDYLTQHKDVISQAYALNRAFEHVKIAADDIYTWDADATGAVLSDVMDKFQTAIKFARDAVDLIDEQPNIDIGRLRTNELRPGIQDKTLCDHIAELMFELLTAASSVRGKSFTVWHLMHNTAWTNTLGHSGNGKACRAVNFKLRRLLYKEIKNLETWPNFRSANVLGLCLYVMGLDASKKKTSISRDYLALKEVVLKWTRRNYLRLASEKPIAAAACLVGSLSFDQTHGRLCKAYEKGLEQEAPVEYLYLDPMRPEAAAPPGAARRPGRSG